MEIGSKIMLLSAEIGNRAKTHGSLVARMERSVIRDRLTPDYAALHPGYWSRDGRCNGAEGPENAISTTLIGILPVGPTGSMRVKIAVMGSVGVGGYFGARLATGGADVTFVARGDHLAAMREHGLTVEGGPDEIRLRSVNAVEDPAAIGIVDLVIFAVKL